MNWKATNVVSCCRKAWLLVCEDRTQKRLQRSGCGDLGLLQTWFTSKKLTYCRNSPAAEDGDVIGSSSLRSDYLSLLWACGLHTVYRVLVL